jgi:methionyl-tRNA formyltransferase
LVAAGLDPNRPDQRSVVELVEIQPAGKKRMHAADFLRGHPLLPDDRFGPAILP